MSMLIALVTCSTTVHAQTLTDGYYTFIIPDEYEEGIVGDFYSTDTGNILFNTMESTNIDTEDEYKRYLELMGNSFATNSYSYTIAYGTKNGIHYFKYHGFEDTDMLDVLIVAIDGHGLTIYGTNAADAVNSAYESITVSAE